jgi:hypothetical protein
LVDPEDKDLGDGRTKKIITTPNQIKSRKEGEGNILGCEGKFWSRENSGGIA